MLKVYNPKTISWLSQKGALVHFFRHLEISEVFKSQKSLTVPVVITDRSDELERSLAKEKIFVGEVWRKVQLDDDRPIDSLYASQISDCPLIATKPSSIAITVINIRNPGDKRWNSMGIPSSAQIVMGALKKAQHFVRYRNVVAGTDPLDFALDCDCIGIGVYEDTIFETIQLIDRIKKVSSLPILLGGPMVTLMPDYVIAHCNQADAFLRGEVEKTLPKLLEALFAERETHSIGSLIKMANIEGVYAQGETWAVSGDFQRAPIIENFDDIELALDMDAEPDPAAGFEYSTSRGCPRSCVFCSHVHGKKIRSYPDFVIKKHLEWMHESLVRSARKQGIRSDYYSININDDDILLDPDRALRILDMCRSSGFQIWGIQTSIDSLSSKSIREHVFSSIREHDYFVDSKPLFWIGTDAFISQRLRRFGKPGTSESIRQICEDIDRFGFIGYHYWIVTDAETDWPEFIEELIFLDTLCSTFPKSFRILPNSPSLIPYPSTPVYAARIKKGHFDRIVLKGLLEIPGYSELDYPVIRHERPKDDFLYAMVEPYAQTPEKLLVHPERFLQLIKENCVDNAIMECLRVLNMAIQTTSDLERREQMNRVRDHILSFSGIYQDRME